MGCFGWLRVVLAGFKRLWVSGLLQVVLLVLAGFSCFACFINNGLKKQNLSPILSIGWSTFM